MSRLVACPHCKTETQWSSENDFRPFCSERCKLQDLGAWFLEERSIKGSISIANGLDLNEIDLADLPGEMSDELKNLLN